MKGILKRTAGTGITFWTITFPHGTDHLSDNSIFVLERANLDRAASSIMVCREDEDKLTNEDYDTIVDFEIVDKQWDNGGTYREAKIIWNVENK
jgi:hypothetical protein